MTRTHIFYGVRRYFQLVIFQRLVASFRISEVIFGKRKEGEPVGTK